MATRRTVKRRSRKVIRNDEGVAESTQERLKVVS
jgi:hypothetical protein